MRGFWRAEFLPVSRACETEVRASGFTCTDGGRARVTDWLLIGAGGFLGANMRYALSLWAAHRYGAAFPYGTLVANLSGCLAMGLVMGLLAGWAVDDDQARLFLATGFIGAETTFSTFTFQSFELLHERRTGAALLNVLGSSALGMIAVALGLLCAHVVTELV